MEENEKVDMNEFILHKRKRVDKCSREGMRTERQVKIFFWKKFNFEIDDEMVFDENFNPDRFFNILRNQIKYQKTYDELNISHSDNFEILGNDLSCHFQNFCTICLSHVDLNINSKYFLKCGHVFHDKCILNWLRMSLICPNCKKQVYSSRYNHDDYSSSDSAYYEEEELFQLLLNSSNHNLNPNFNLLRHIRNNSEFNRFLMRHYPRRGPSDFSYQTIENYFWMVFLFLFIMAALLIFINFKLFIYKY